MLIFCDFLKPKRRFIFSFSPLFPPFSLFTLRAATISLIHPLKFCFFGFKKSPGLLTSCLWQNSVVVRPESLLLTRVSISRVEYPLSGMPENEIMDLEVNAGEASNSGGKKCSNSKCLKAIKQSGPDNYKYCSTQCKNICAVLRNRDRSNSISSQ